jgi:putative transposase
LRRCVAHLRATLAISERRACALLGQPRSTQRYAGQSGANEKSLIERIRQLSAKHPRFGYRRLWILLTAEGFEVNQKRVYRICREHGASKRNT